MSFWPFRRQPQEPKWSINLHSSVQRHVSVAAAWTCYGGTKALARLKENVESNAEVQGYASSFDEECYARDAMAEYWAVQPAETRGVDAYLQLLVSVRSACFIREYVWCFLRQDSWPQPAGLSLDAFAAWCLENGLSQHKPITLAFISLGAPPR